MELRVFLCITLTILCANVVPIASHPRHHRQHNNDNDNKLLTDYSDEVVSQFFSNYHKTNFYYNHSEPL